MELVGTTILVTMLDNRIHLKSNYLHIITKNLANYRNFLPNPTSKVPFSYTVSLYFNTLPQK